MAATPEPARPWYRHFWPWVVFGLPAAAVVASFTTLYLAGPIPAMVVDDYGKIEAESQKDYARDVEAGVLGVTARLERTPSGGGELIVVRLDESVTGPRPEFLEVDLLHPTLERLDRHAVLRPGPDGDFRGTVEPLGGRYHVRLGDPGHTWRLTGDLSPGEPATTLVARTDAAADATP